MKARCVGLNEFFDACNHLVFRCRFELILDTYPRGCRAHNVDLTAIIDKEYAPRFEVGQVYDIETVIQGLTLVATVPQGS